MEGAIAAAPPQRGIPSRVFIPLLLPFLILIGIAVYAAVTPYDSTNLPPPGQRGQLVWGDAIFANQRELKAWLRLHGGGDFREWAKQHPAALRLVKPVPRKHHAAVQAKAKVKKPARIARAAPASAVTLPTSAAKGSGPAKWLFTALGLVLAFGAVATPRRLVARLVAGPVRSDRDMRLAVAGAAIAVLAGVAVATFLG